MPSKAKKMQTRSAQHCTMIVEPSADGHRLYYVQLLIEGALNRGDQVILVTSEIALSRPEFELNLGKLTDRIQITSSEDFTVDSIAQLASRHNVDLTVVPDGDAFTYKLARLRKWNGPGRVSTLLMRESVSPTKLPGLRVFRNFLKRFLVRRANRMNSVKVTTLKSAFWHGSSRGATVNDPVSLEVTPHEVEVTKTELGLTSDRYWFALVGAIAQRKNPVMVLEAVALCKPVSLGVVIAGNIDPDVGAQLSLAADNARKAGQQVVIVNRLLDPRELDAIVAAVDCVVLAHSNEGPSGILGKAAAAGTRIVSAGALSLREDALSCPELMSWHPLGHASLKEAFLSASGMQRPVNNVALPATDFATALL